MIKQRSAHAGFFIFRRPLLSLTDLSDLSGPDQSTNLNAAADQEEACLRLLERAEFRRAVGLQSPSLRTAIDRTLAAGNRIACSPIGLAVYRYAARSAWRGAPRGLFAGVGLGHISHVPHTPSVVTPRAHVRIDFSLDYLSALVDQVVKDESLYRLIPLVRNPTLVRFGDIIHLRSHRSGLVRPAAETIQLEASPLLRKLVASLGAGQMEPRDVKRWMLASGVSEADLDGRLRELIEAEVLVPALAVCPVSSDPVRDALCALPDVAPWRTITRTLQATRTHIRRIRSAPSELSLEMLEQHRDSLPPVPGFEAANRAFNVETHWTGCNIHLASQQIDQVAKVIHCLHVMFGDLGNGRLDGVRQAFADRFGEATVPLPQVLDAEHGVGEAIEMTAPPDRWALRGRRTALLRRLHESLANGGQTVELDADFVAAFNAADLPPMPPACAALLRCVVPSTTNGPLEPQEITLQAVVGCTGSELWGRHARSEPAIAEAAESLGALLSNGETDVVLAEVILAPPSCADLASRPNRHRVRILCSPVPPEPNTVDLTLNDLYVRIVNERICLMSRRLGGEIRPIVGSSIDPARVGSPAYRFLCLLSYQDWATPLKWEWGELQDSPFLPCVRMGNVILSQPKWRIDRAELAELDSIGASQPSDRTRWCHWLRSRKLPRWAAVCDIDESLPCDLWQPWGEAMIRQAVRRHGYVCLEALPSALDRSGDDSVDRGNQVCDQVTELIVPMTYTQSPRCNVQTLSTRVRSADWMGKFGEGVRLPGSDWLYAKLYASPFEIDRVLRNELPKVLQRLRDECAVRTWFFFRYRDTSWHLRLRVHLPRAALRSRAREIVESAANDMLSREIIWRLQFDTYFREIERFGGAQACDLVEQLFSAESDLALAALRVSQDESKCADSMIQLAASWVSWTWQQLGLTLVERRTLCNVIAPAHKHLSSAIKPSSGDPGALTESARVAMRTRARALRHLPFERVDAPTSPWREYSQRALRSLKSLRQLADAGELVGGTRSLAANLSHLLVVRLFPENHDAHERELYVQLSRLLRRSQEVERRGTPISSQIKTVHEIAASSS